MRTLMFVITMVWTIPSAATACGGFLDLDCMIDSLGPLGRDVGESIGRARPSQGSDPRQVLATRIFAGPDQYPPENYAAYGIVAFKSRSNSSDLARHRMICEAYVSALPFSGEVDADRQMVTVWPMDSNIGAAIANGAARRAVCDLAIEGYGLPTSLGAIRDARNAGVDVRGRGPFLLAWSPASAKGRSDTVVLWVDLSDVDDSAQALDIFQNWVNNIEQAPELWDDINKPGWDIERVRISIRNWFDRYGSDILQVVNAE